MNYDVDRKEYYITVDDVLAYTTLNADDLGSIFNDVNKSLKVMSASVYRLIYNFYKGIRRREHILYVRMKIDNNTQDEQMYLKMAMIELVKGAYESGMDLNSYINEPKNPYPKTVYQELSNAELLTRTEKYV